MKRLLYFFTILFTCCVSAEAAEKEWYVAVHGENFQLITGASSTPNITDGKFLDLKYVGKEIYVKSKEHYELDQYRPKPAGEANGATSSTEASAAVGNSPEKPKDMSEFGPLTDTGLQYALNGDFHGWECSNLYVKPMGDKTYRLRCDKSMKHQ